MKNNNPKTHDSLFILESQFLEKILSIEQFEKAVNPLRQQLKELLLMEKSTGYS